MKIERGEKEISHIFKMIDSQRQINLSPSAGQSFGRPKSVRKPLVLIVENHDDTRSMLKTILEVWDYETAEAANGVEAVNVAAAVRPDLVLMDVTLPHKDGIDAMHDIHALTALARVPVVLISGHAQSDFRHNALALGGSDFLVKPVDLGQLETALADNLARSAARAARGKDTLW
jgi:CheY-like chemotaxis protein